MKNVITLITVLSFLIVNGQNAWMQIYSTNTEDKGESVEQTTDGGYIITGEIDTSLCLIKTNAFGSVTWTKTYFTNYKKGYGKSVQQTNDGGYIIGGYVIDSTNNYSALLIKTNALGDTLWTGLYNDNSARIKCNSIEITSDGGYIFTGKKEWQSLNTWSWTSDLIVLKTDGQGVEQWRKTYGVPDTCSYCDMDIGCSILQSLSGEYFVWGETYIYNSTPKRHPWLLKLDANGDTLWTKTYNGGFYDYSLNSASQTSDGGFIAVGEEYYTSSGLASIYLLKTDSIGNKEWSKIYTSVYMVGNDVKQTLDGGYIIIAETEVPPAYYENALLIKTNALGDTLWSKTFGSAIESDYGFSVQQTTDGGYVFTGFTESYGTPDVDDVWLVKTDANGDTIPTNSQIDENNLFVNQIYPNPFTTSTTIELPSEPHILTIYDIVGNKVREEQVIGTTVIERGDLTKGVYVIEVRSERQTYSGKLVVE